jgi:hypothetical protein
MKLSAEQKELNRLARVEKKRLAIIEQEKQQKQIDRITFSIEWSRNGNPTCTAWGHFADGTAEKFISRAGGYGYCKESTVIASAFNHFLKYCLYEINQTENMPYGIRLYNSRYYYEGGVGTNCYYDISQFIGGNFRKVAFGNTYDAYEFTTNKN